MLGGGDRAMATLRRADQDSMALDQRANQLQTDLEGLKSQAAHPPATAQGSPSEAFGSAAMFLATMGSLMTRHPFTTALNAGADVMEAYRKRDIEKAQAAFQTWKAQMDTAMTLHRFEQDAYKAAVDKVSRDREGAKTDLAVTAAAMKDAVVLHLVESGRMDDAVNLIAGRRVMGQRAGAAGGAMQNAATRAQYLAAYQAAERSGDKEKMAQIEHEMDTFVRFTDPTAARAGVVAGEKDPTRQARIDAWQELAAARAAGDQDGVKEAQQKLDDIRRASDKKTSSVSAPTATQEVTAATRALVDDKIMKENADRVAQGKPPMTPVEEAQLRQHDFGEVQARTNTLTPAIVRDYQRVIDKSDTGLEHADQALNIMNNNIAVAGGLGKLGRAAETIGNIVGSEGTARAEFRNHISMLKEAMADSQNTSGARPLAAQMKLIEDILATNNWGVSSRAAFSAIQQVADELYHRHQVADSHLKGTWSADQQYRSLSPVPFGAASGSSGSTPSGFDQYPVSR